MARGVPDIKAPGVNGVPVSAGPRVMFCPAIGEGMPSCPAADGSGANEEGGGPAEDPGARSAATLDDGPPTVELGATLDGAGAGAPTLETAAELAGAATPDAATDEGVDDFPAVDAGGVAPVGGRPPADFAPVDGVGDLEPGAGVGDFAAPDAAGDLAAAAALGADAADFAAAEAGVGDLAAPPPAGGAGDFAAAAALDGAGDLAAAGPAGAGDFAAGVGDLAAAAEGVGDLAAPPVAGGFAAPAGPAAALLLGAGLLPPGGFAAADPAADAGALAGGVAARADIRENALFVTKSSNRIRRRKEKIRAAVVWCG